MIQVDTSDQRQRFQKDDLDVLASVASQAAIAVDNAQLHETSLRQQAIERDLELAHKVQRGLLPAAPPQLPGYYFFDFYEPANQVGGDYYDYVELPGNRLAVVRGRRLRQGRGRGSVDGQALGRGPLLPGQRGRPGGRPSIASTPASAVAAGKTGS